MVDDGYCKYKLCKDAFIMRLNKEISDMDKYRSHGVVVPYAIPTCLYILCFCAKYKTRILADVFLIENPKHPPTTANQAPMQTLPVLVYTEGHKPPTID